MNKLLICYFLGLLILISCERNINYCYMHEQKGLTPEKEVFFLYDSINVSFDNYWEVLDLDSVDIFYVASNRSKLLLFKNDGYFHKYYSLNITLNKESSIENFKKNYFSALRAENVDIDNAKEIIKTINGIDYEILIFDNNLELSLIVYGQYSEEFILQINTGFYKPFQDSLNQIENQKEELTDELLNRLYCVLSTLEVKSKL